MAAKKPRPYPFLHYEPGKISHRDMTVEDWLELAEHTIKMLKEKVLK